MNEQEFQHQLYLKRDKRNTLLQDLRENIIELSINHPQHPVPIMLKCTLRKDFLPPNHNAFADNTFHEQHPTALVVWDILDKQYRGFEIDFVAYAQSIDYMQFK
jgi:hypothetical protein